MDFNMQNDWDFDDYIWKSDDHIVEMKMSELKRHKLVAFSTGLLVGAVAVFFVFLGVGLYLETYFPT